MTTISSSPLVVTPGYKDGKRADGDDASLDDRHCCTDTRRADEKVGGGISICRFGRREASRMGSAFPTVNI
jgi:hypothetical protein